MDRRQTQLSDEEHKVVQDSQRRRKRAINLSSHSSMDQITVEFVLPTAVRGGNNPEMLLLDVAGNWTVEQVT